MRILMVGGFQAKKAGARFYDVTPKLAHGLIRLGHNVLMWSDRDVARLSTWTRSRKYGTKGANKALLATVADYMPDIIILHHADTITRETLGEIRAKWPQIKLAHFNVDALFNQANVDRIKAISDLVDATFITTYGPARAQVKAGKSPVYFVPNPVDSSVETGRAFEHNGKYDLFITLGRSRITDDPREVFLQELQAKLPKLKLGAFIGGTPECPNGLWGDAYQRELANSKCGLNLSRQNGNYQPRELENLCLYSSDRISHYVGNGLLTFTDSAFQLDQLFTADKEMIFYSDVSDLSDKLNLYLKDDKARRKVAKAGWQKAHKEFSSDKIGAFMLQVLQGEKIKSADYAWPTDGL